jgi:VanZ family protein
MPGPRISSNASSFLKVAFVAALCVVSYLSLVPGTQLPKPGINDKIQHGSAYAVLALIGLVAFPGRPRALAAFLVAWGALMEIGQSFAPNRSPEFADLIANSTGVAIAWIVFLLAGRILSPGPPMAAASE